MTENTIIDLVKLNDVYNYVMNDLPELYVKYLEKMSKRKLLYKQEQHDLTSEYFNGYLAGIENTYNRLAKMLDISKTISERIYELNL